MKLPTKPIGNRRHAAFTLPEVLVVIAIIAVLATVLFSVTSKIREKSLSARCSSGMRQIGVAMISYASENNSRLPAVRGDLGDGGPGRVWFEAILPHLGETVFDHRMPEQSLICPVWQRLLRDKYKKEPATSWLRTGYGMSYVMAGSPTKGGPNWSKVDYAVRLAEIPDPGRMIMVADEHGWNWGIHSQNYKSSSYFKPESGVERGLRHGKHANFLFVDGHVESLNQESIYPYLAK